MTEEEEFCQSCAEVPPIPGEEVCQDCWEKFADEWRQEIEENFIADKVNRGEG